jgi:hypothetical protein
MINKITTSTTFTGVSIRISTLSVRQHIYQALVVFTLNTPAARLVILLLTPLLGVLTFASSVGAAPPLPYPEAHPPVGVQPKRPIVTQWPADGRIQVPAIPVQRIESASVLNTQGTPGFTQPTANGLVVDLSGCTPADPRVSVVVLRIAPPPR